MSDSSTTVIKLLKILIGVAWLDGTVQQAEQVYLRKLADQKGVSADPELKPWLYGLRSVSKSECYAWIEDYLGPKVTTESYHQLLEDLSGLIYSDGDVAAEEAKFLAELQQLDPGNEESVKLRKTVILSLQKLYQRWVSS
ncbi:MAG: TerB family tellurite resistance protein [Acaryochloridaceae cyanobacterium SU_2_1]|nr:TerB family tellurite resistance protein [Acaryochloridaceae cyanobacterium SU_2_1]NJM95125.1 TerB family tellurite resistance protein [Acaryochloridaceae cyanobacterium CSU_5_19]